MTAVRRDLPIEQGATFVLAFQWCQPGVNATTPGLPHNLTGFTARMQIRKVRGAPVLVEATTENSRIVLGQNLAGVDLGPASGWIKLVLPASVTNLLIVGAKYDLEVEDTSGRVYRLLQGEVAVDPNITQPVTP